MKTNGMRIVSTTPSPEAMVSHLINGFRSCKDAKQNHKGGMMRSGVGHK
jgi:hypothetical protein